MQPATSSDKIETEPTKDVRYDLYKMAEDGNSDHQANVEKRLEDYVTRNVLDVDFTAEESKKVGRKMDRYLLSILIFLQISFYLDKSNIGNANTAGLSRDLGLSSSQYTALLTLFYCVYLVFQWQLILFKVFPVHLWVAFCALGWGTASIAQAGAHNFAGIIVARVFLAIFEAGVAPGISLYISMMWTRGEYGFRWAFFQCAAALGNCFAGALAYGLVHAKSSLDPWRLVFLVEGIPSILLVPVVYFFLPDAPNKCKWFTARENEVAKARIEKGNADANEGLTWAGLRESLLDPWTWFAGILHFLGSTSFNSIAVFCSAIVKAMGFSAINAQGLQAPPFFLAWLVGITAAWFSDRVGKRGPFIIVASLIGGIGYTMLITQDNQYVKYVGVLLLASGVYTSQPLMYAWCSNNVATKSKRAFTMAIFSITGQCGSVLGTNVYPSRDGPLYIKGNSVCAGACYLTVLMTIGGMYYCHMKNKRKDALYGKPDPTAVTDVTLHGEASTQWRYLL